MARIVPFLLLIALVLLPQTQIHAVYRGRQVQARQSQVCRVVIRDNEQKFVTFCSGTFVNKRKFVTAGHCLNSSRANNYKVECDIREEQSGSVAQLENYSLTHSGNLALTDGYTAGLSVSPTGVRKLANEVPERTAGYEQNDVGVLEFSSDQPVNSMELFDPTRDRNLKFNRCFMLGFGASRLMRGRFASNMLNMGQVSDVDKIAGGSLRVTSSSALCNLTGKLSTHASAAGIAKVLMKMQLPTHPIALPGDSGGPLVCLTAKGERRLMGVMSHYEMHAIDGRSADRIDAKQYFAGAGAVQRALSLR